MAKIWEAMELAATTPFQFEEAAAPLIPKSGGKGWRDIGLFAGFVRVGTKARQKYCRKWEADNDRGYWACGEGRSAPDVVWRAALRAETAKAKGGCAAACLQDVRSFYQMLDHQKLRTRAARSGFPTPLARLAVHLYTRRRRLSFKDRASGEAIQPDRGVVPGCCWAGTLAKVYCLEPMDGVCARNPGIELDVYVDDIQAGAANKEEKSEEQVANEVAAATLDIKETIEQDIGASVASDKTAVVASTEALRKAIRKKIGREDAGEDDDHTIALGVDFSAGRRRGTGGKKRATATRQRTIANKKAPIHINGCGSRQQEGKKVDEARSGGARQVWH